MLDWIENPRLALFLIVGLAFTVLVPPIARRIAIAWRGRRSTLTRTQLASHCPAHLQLTDAQWQRLGRQVSRFLAHKHFVGCAGLRMTDEARLAVAVPACLLWLAGPERLPYPALRYIQLYPAEWTPHARWQDAELPPSPQRARWRGAHQRVLLSYSARQQTVYDFNGGRNAGLYELIATGAESRGGEPLLHSPGAFGTWALLRCRRGGWQLDAAFSQPEVLAANGLTAPAELFAAALEGFMSDPQDFAAEHPQLYQAVRRQLALGG